MDILASLNTFYCRGRSGLSPPSCCHAGRTRVTTNALRWTVCSGYNVPAPAICYVPVLPLRRRLPRGGISRSPPTTAMQPRILRLQYQNRWHRNAENHYHQAYTEGFAVFIFVSSRQTSLASTARLSFFYRHHNAYRIQEMPNHNSSTWENESELIHFFVSRIWMNLN